jgi:hypothetical protein
MASKAQRQAVIQRAAEFVRRTNLRGGSMPEDRRTYTPPPTNLGGNPRVDIKVSIPVKVNETTEDWVVTTFTDSDRVVLTHGVQEIVFSKADLDAAVRALHQFNKPQPVMRNTGGRIGTS